MGFKPRCTWGSGKHLCCCIIFSGCVQLPQEVGGWEGWWVSEKADCRRHLGSSGEEMHRGKEELICLGALIILIPQFWKINTIFDSLKRERQRLQESRWCFEVKCSCSYTVYCHVIVEHFPFHCCHQNYWIESFKGLYGWELLRKLKSKPWFYFMSKFWVDFAYGRFWFMSRFLFYGRGQMHGKSRSRIYHIFMHTNLWLLVLCHCLLLFSCLGWDSNNNFNLWERLVALCKSRYYCHISKLWMPNSLGLWYTQMVFIFCISANVITKYNNFSSKVIRAHLAPSLVCPTCYLLITLWEDLVVLLLLRAKWLRG